MALSFRQDCADCQRLDKWHCSKMLLCNWPSIHKQARLGTPAYMGKHFWHKTAMLLHADTARQRPDAHKAALISVNKGNSPAHLHDWQQNRSDLHLQQKFGVGSLPVTHPCSLQGPLQQSASLWQPWWSLLYSHTIWAPAIFSALSILHMITCDLKLFVYSPLTAAALLLIQRTHVCSAVRCSKSQLCYDCLTALTIVQSQLQVWSGSGADCVCAPQMT